MSKKNKLVRKVQPVIDNLPETADAKRRRRKNNTILISSAILAFIIGVSVLGWYLAYKRPLLTNVAAVNGKKISVDYILRRCLMSIYNASTNTTTGNADPLGMIQSILQEQIVEQDAAKPPYNIKVTEADIDQALRSEANLSSSDTSTTTTTPIHTLTDTEFNEWYRQTLNNTQLSDKELRELIKVNIMEQRLNTYLADNMPTTADQVHLWDIIVSDQTQAADIKQRIDNGEDFSTIAKELSIDTSTNAQGGDMGWVPLKVLDANLEYTANKADIGMVSAPLQLSTVLQQDSSSASTAPFYLLMVTEKATTKEIDNANYISALQGRLLQDWIDTQMSSKENKIELHGRGSSGGYDSSTNAWILYQIERLKRSRGIKNTTTTTAANPLTGQ
jgi:foldase protein PrsA